jgi:hypothetical protein
MTYSTDNYFSTFNILLTWWLNGDIMCILTNKEGGFISPREKQSTERINVFLSVEHLDAIKKEAEEKGTTVSGLIRMIVIEHLNSKKEK